MSVDWDGPGVASPTLSTSRMLAMDFVPLTAYSADQLRTGVSLDGPCLMPDGTFALFISLSGFLIQAVILETVYCAAVSGASTDGATAAELRKLKRHVKPVALPAWSGKTEFLASNGIVGFAYPDADLFHIELAAHDREPFEAIEDMLSDWPEVGF